METIIFRGNQYSIREVTLPKVGDVLISTIQLNSDLFDITGNYVSIEASFIDDQIFFFVAENEIKLSENSLKRLLLNQVK